MIMGGYTLAFAIGGLAWGSFIGRLGEPRVMRLTLIGIIASGIMMGLVNHSGGSGPLLWISTAGFFLAVLVQSGFAPAAVSYMARLSAGLTEDRGLFMGLYSVVLGLGQVLGSWLGGPLADHFAMDGVLILTLIFGLAAGLCVWNLPIRPPAVEDEERVAGTMASAELPG
jgi:MFS family permease